MDQQTAEIEVNESARSLWLRQIRSTNGESDALTSKLGNMLLCFQNFLIYLESFGVINPFQITAFSTGAVICASSARGNLSTAKDVALMVPSSSIASGWKPKVASRAPNLLAA